MKKILLSMFAIAAIFSSNAQTTLYSENFESTTGSALPVGFTQTTAATDGGWRTSAPTTAWSATAGLTSTSYAPLALAGSTRCLGTNDDGCNCNKLSDKIVTATFSCTGQPSVFFSADFFYFDASYSGSQETLTVQISTNGGSTWSDIANVVGAAGWNNQMWDISNKAGNQASVQIAFLYNDGSGWLYGAAVDNIKAYVPPAFDVTAQTLVLAPFTALTATPISGVMQNLGGATITSMTLNYKVDALPTVSQNITSLSIPSIASYNYNASTMWTPATTGSHTVKVWADNINGGVDAIHSNDTAYFTTITPSVSQIRTVLYEGFSSSTCGPCASINPTTLALLQSNNANGPGGLVAAIKYQMNYPSPGTDPAYTAECGTRATLYGVNGIPHGEVDGGNGGYAYEGHPYYFDQLAIDKEAAVPSPISLNATAVYNGATVTVSGTANAFANLNGSNKVMIALVEQDILTTDGGHGQQTNGETEWHNVMRKMTPTATGTNLGNLVDGQSYPFTASSTFTGYTTAGTGTPKIFTNIATMQAVVFVQDLTSKKVYQAAFTNLVTAVNETESTLSTLDIYPNPNTTDITNIKFTLKNDNAVVVNVFNMMGEVVFAQNMGNLNAGLNNLSFSTSTFANGVYNIVINAGDQNTSRKLMITK